MLVVLSLVILIVTMINTSKSHVRVQKGNIPALLFTVVDGDHKRRAIDQVGRIGGLEKAVRGLK